MESEHKNTLKKIVMDLKQLVEIFRELQRADALTTQAGVQELKTREKITNYLHLVSSVIFQCKATYPGCLCLFSVSCKCSRGPHVRHF